MPIDPATAILASGAMSAVGSGISSMMGASSAKKQMKFQKRMSNTAHQREMADLKKAGLNPLLTGKYGGSSTPTGVAFTPENPLKDAGQTASAYGSLKQAKPLVTAQVNSQNATTAKTMAETDLLKANTQNILDQTLADVDLKKSSSALSSVQTKKGNQEIKALKEELKKLKITRALYDQAGKLLPYPQKIIKQIKEVKTNPTGWKRFFIPKLGHHKNKK